MKKLTDTDSSPVVLPVFMPRDAVGTKNLPANTISALDYFLLFFDNETIDKICIHSNSYAELYTYKYPYSYSRYPDEGLNRNFYLFLCVVIYMGLHPRDDNFSYWSTDPLYSSEFVKAISHSRETFSSILTFFAY